MANLFFASMTLMWNVQRKEYAQAIEVDVDIAVIGALWYSRPVPGQ